MAANHVEEEVAEDTTVNLEPGLLIAHRWKVIGKLGEGGCGSVYKVQDNLHKESKITAAMKVESNTVDGGVLKLEVKILKKLGKRLHVAHLLQAGKKATYSYMITELLGMSLDKLTLKKGKTATVSTQVRVGMQCLFGLKQLHEVGFVHRDVKPANLAIGVRGAEVRILHLLDFGLSREFVIRTKKGVRIREPRKDALFRGTLHYASVQSLQGSEQGRVDDLWSLVYVIAELRDRLPWAQYCEKEDILKSKIETHDAELFFNSPAKLAEIPAHLRKLNYYSRPDYFLMFNILQSIMTTAHLSHSDPFDWEVDGSLEGIAPGGKKSVRIVEKEPKTILPKGGAAEEIVELSIESPLELDEDEKPAHKGSPLADFTQPTQTSAVVKKSKVAPTSAAWKKWKSKSISPMAFTAQTQSSPRTARQLSEHRSPIVAKLFSAKDFEINELGL